MGKEQLLDEAGFRVREVVPGEQRPALGLHGQAGKLSVKARPYWSSGYGTEQGLEELDLVVGEIEVRLHLLDVAAERHVDERRAPARPPSSTS